MLQRWIARHNRRAMSLLLLAITLYLAQWASAARTEQLPIAVADAILPVVTEFAVTPQVSAPGASISLSIHVTNPGPTSVAPSITLDLPLSLAIDLRRLPPGATLNVPTNSLNWQPVIPPGAQKDLALPLEIRLADLQNPERVITGQLAWGDYRQALQADYWVGLPPQVTILSPAQIAVGQPLTLFADVFGSGPFTQTWQLGDGRLFSAANPSVIYGTPGEYDLSLVVANPLAETTAHATLNVVSAPAATFTLPDTSVAVAELVTFTNQSGGQPPLRYTWDFGDGVTSDEISPQHAFSLPGVYVVRLVTENAYGRAETQLNLVAGVPPVADLVLPESATAGNAVHGQAFGDDSVTEFLWDMGDGRLLTGPEITHNYDAAGRYLVTLRARNEFGDTQVERLLDVAPGRIQFYLPVVIRGYGDLGIDAQLAEILDHFQPLSLELDAPPNASSAAEQLFWYANKARQTYGLKPLTFVFELSVAAQQHTDDMASHNFTGHTGSDGSRPPQRQQRAGYLGYYAGEATAWGMRDVTDVVEFWVNSPSHRVMILNPQATQLGVGHTFDVNARNLWYWTVEFGSDVNPSPLPIFPTPTPLTPTLPLSPTLQATPTLTPTATPTPTPTPSPTPSPTPTATPSPTPTPLPDISIPVSTPLPPITPTATPTPDAGRSLSPAPSPTPPDPFSDPVAVTVAFLDALWRDRSGWRGLPYLSDELQAALTGTPMDLAGLTGVDSFAVFNRVDEGGRVTLWVNVSGVDGAVHRRVFVVASNSLEWRIVSISKAGDS